MYGEKSQSSLLGLKHVQKLKQLLSFCRLLCHCQSSLFDQLTDVGVTDAENELRREFLDLWENVLNIS